MEYIEAKELKKALRAKKPVLLLDVREPEEFKSGHIKNAVLMPWHLVEEKIRGTKKDRIIVLYCTNLPRSYRAGKTLEDLGYKNVKILEYGWEGWQLT